MKEPDTPAIWAEGLQRKFGDKYAVDNVNLSVARGEIYGFLGPNGAGKSTCVRMLTTLLTPTAGQATVAGFDVVRQAGDVRLRIGLALQEAALDDKQTGRELLALQGRLYGLSRAQTKARIAEIISFIDIGSAFDDRLGTYSGGMKRRVDLAAALMHNPQVLFLDEPTTGLDPISRAKVWEEVRHLNQTLGMTVFLTTQYLEEADQLAHRIGIINHGTLVVEGPPDELKRRIGTDVIVARVRDPERAAEILRGVPGVDSVDAATADHDVAPGAIGAARIGEERSGEVRIGAANGAALISPVAVALSAAGIAVENLALRTPTLDDVFVSMTGERIGDAAENTVAA